MRSKALKIALTSLVLVAALGGLMYTTLQDGTEYYIHVDEVVHTRVRLLPITTDEITWYVRSGEPIGKAGAYGIQGRAARFIDWIEGSWSNVVGLPVATVYRLLKELGA